MKGQNTYFSTFISGVSDIVESALKSVLPSAQVQLVLDGLCVYSTSTPVSDVQKLRFLNNTFLLLNQFNNLGNNAFETMFSWALSNLSDSPVSQYIRQTHLKNFRIVLSKENVTVSYNRQLIAKLEKHLSEQLGISVARNNPDVEFWFLLRSEGYGFYGLRITNKSLFEHRKKGQLRPELAHILCLLSEPHKGDAFLDPFAGYGTIVQERSRFPYKQILAVEKDKDVSSSWAVAFANGRDAELINEDFFEAVLDNELVDKIVTDPPWGMHEDTINIEEFYNSMFRKFKNVLVDQGLVVLLTGRKETAELLLADYGAKLLERYDVLVSGKKAGIYKFRF